MNLNPRERVLILCFPAAIVLAAYAWFFGNPAQREWSSARGRLEEARAEAAQPWQLMEAKQEQQRLATRCTELEERRGRLLDEAGRLCDRRTEPCDLLGAADVIGRTLRENRLLVIEDAQASRGDMGLATSLEESQNQLASVWSETQREMLQEQKSPAGGQKATRSGVTVEADYMAALLNDLSRTRPDVTVRRVRFIGTFDDTSRALAALSRTADRALPVCISMESPGLGVMQSPSRVWTLTVKM